MARGGCDYSQLAALGEAFSRLTAAEMDALCVDCSKALAARLLALVIPKTPVGKYPKSSGKKGGTLRRAWGAKNGNAAASYAAGLNVKKSGNNYTIEIINPLEYASYVEFGHRTVNGVWVEGQYMLTVSEETLKRVAPSVIEKMVLKKIQEVCNV